MKINYNNIPKFGMIGKCHYCTKRTIIVGCFLDCNPTDCNVMYCLSCLQNCFEENLEEIADYRKFYDCPFKRNICTCNNCNNEYLIEEKYENNKSIDLVSKVDKIGYIIEQLKSNLHLLNNHEKSILFSELKNKFENISEKIIENRL